MPSWERARTRHDQKYGLCSITTNQAQLKKSDNKLKQSWYRMRHGLRLSN